MGYTTDPTSVRVDFFKPGPSAKWYTTEAVKWTGDYDNRNGNGIHDSFAKSLRDHFGKNPERLSDMDAVCLYPYHEHTHPIQLRRGAWVHWDWNEPASNVPVEDE